MSNAWRMRGWLLVFLISSIWVRAADPGATGWQTNMATLSVTGRGEMGSPPDLAVVQLGAVAEASTAVQAQERVNEIVQTTLAAVKALKIADRDLQTSGFTLAPVYSRDATSSEEPVTPKITGYRASNIVQMRIRDLKRVGEIVDAGIKAGANQIEGLSFLLENDLAARQEALRRAVNEARSKAETIADAMGARLAAVLDVTEGSVDVVRPMIFTYAKAGPGAGTPVQSGEVTVQANVTVKYNIVKK